MTDPAGKVLARVTRSKNRLYILPVKQEDPVCLSAVHEEEAWKWHARYGHVNFQALKKLVREGMVRGMPLLDSVEKICDGCMLGKQRRLSFPAQASYRATQPLQLVHGDLCGPITLATNGGKKYFLLLVDDMSRYMWVILLKSKDEASAAIKKFSAAAELESGHKLKVLRTDRRGEFASTEFVHWCEELGKKRHLKAPYSPQQNGGVERRNQTVVGTARSLLKSMSVPARLWGEAVCTAVYLLNRAPTKSLVGKTPYEAWYNRKPSVSHLRTFGCVSPVKKVGPHQAKLDDRSAPMVFIGYEEQSKAYRMFDPVSKKLIVTRDAVFDEGRQWQWRRDTVESEAVPCPTFVIEYPALSEEEAAQVSVNEPAAENEE